MKFKAYTGITWSDLELSGLLEDEDSRVYHEKFKKHLGLHPFHLTNLNAALTEILSSNLNSYDSELKGFLLAYKNPKVLTPLGEILYDTCFIHVDIEAVFYVFRPQVGCIVKGIVNKKGLDHIGVLVHKAFNVSIPKPDDDENWPGDNVEIGQEIRFTITFLDFSSKLPYIRGNLNSDDYLKGCKLKLQINSDTNSRPLNSNSQNNNNSVAKTVSDESNIHIKQQTFFATDSESSSDEQTAQIKKKATQQRKSKNKLEPNELLEYSEWENEYGNEYENEYVDHEDENKQKKRVKDSKETKTKFKFDKTKTMNTVYTNNIPTSNEANYESEAPATSKKHARKKDNHGRSSSNVDESELPEEKGALSEYEVSPNKSSKKKKHLNDTNDSAERHVQHEETFINIKSEVNNDTEQFSKKQHKKRRNSTSSHILESEVENKDVRKISSKKDSRRSSILDISENENIDTEMRNSSFEKPQVESTSKTSKKSKRRSELSTSSSTPHYSSSENNEDHNTYSINLNQSLSKKRSKKTNKLSSESVIENVKIEKEKPYSGSENNENYSIDSTDLNHTLTKKRSKKSNKIDSECVTENVKIEKEKTNSGSENSQTEDPIQSSKPSKKRPIDNSTNSYQNDIEDNSEHNEIYNGNIEKTPSKKRTKKSSLANPEETLENVKVKREIVYNNLGSTQKEDGVKLKKKSKKSSQLNASAYSSEHDSENNERTSPKKRSKKADTSNSEVTLQTVAVKTEIMNNDFENSQEEDYVKQSTISKKGSKLSVSATRCHPDLEEVEIDNGTVESLSLKKRSRKSSTLNSESSFQNVRVKKEWINSCSEDTEVESYTKFSQKLKRNSDVNVSLNSSQDDVEKDNTDNEHKKKQKKHSKKSILNSIKVEPEFENVVIKQEKLDDEIENFVKNASDAGSPKKKKRKIDASSNMNNDETDVQINMRHMKRSESMDTRTETHDVGVKMERFAVDGERFSEMESVEKHNKKQKEHKRSPTKQTSQYRKSELEFDFSEVKVKIERSPDS